MGSGLSQEADTQQQSANTTAITTSSRLNNLPHDYEAILKDADSSVYKSSIDQLYAGVFLNKKKKKYWVDKASHANCFMVFARDLFITWGEDPRYWHWQCIKETSEVVDVAELLNVCWLEVCGKIETAKLTPGIKYEVVFVAMLKDPAYGWHVPVNIKLTLPDGNKQEHKENLMEKPRCKWFEIPVGEFTVDAKKEGCVEFFLYEYEDGGWKKGLLIKGAAIRPKC
uniref:lectin-like isoform X2 n=1 Tax=Erigeron canadensis TaxID=72917 RepID=UPI001CB88CE0|nr:lectin-like isoform X2 [Erigeron canadensis]